MVIIYNKRPTVHQFKLGRGLINNIINKLPIELHLPGYQFCGPGTDLKKRLARGDKGVNLLDAACREHDIAYSTSNDLIKRHQADKILAEKAWQRVKSKNCDLKERTHAWLVTNAMKAKVKFGLGIKSAKSNKSSKLNRMKKKLNKRKLKNKKLFSTVVKKTLKILRKGKPNDVNAAVKIAKNVISSNFNSNKRSNIVIPRVIPIPKIGGFLPIVPILTALSALGGLATGSSAIVKAVNEIKNGKKQLEEANRHNRYMESIAMGKGLYLKPYKTGYGIFYSPNAKNY